MSRRKQGYSAHLDMSQIMGYLQSYHDTFGYMPSQREIAAFFNVSAMAINHWLVKLERNGHIARPLNYRARAIRIVERIEGHEYELG